MKGWDTGGSRLPNLNSLASFITLVYPKLPLSHYPYVKAQPIRTEKWQLDLRVQTAR